MRFSVTLARGCARVAFIACIDWSARLIVASCTHHSTSQGIVNRSMKKCYWQRSCGARAVVGYPLRGGTKHPPRGINAPVCTILAPPRGVAHPTSEEYAFRKLCQNLRTPFSLLFQYLLCFLSIQTLLSL